MNQLKRKGEVPPFFEVVLDIGETPNKCTVASLAKRSDFKFFHVKNWVGPLGPLQSTVLLHHEGECLSSFSNEPVTQSIGIATIDCVWRRLDYLLSRLEKPLPRLARIPAGFETAYPRKSKKDTDPSSGLATIEAIFVASALLGNWDATLFSDYYFGGRFIELNKSRFLEFGVPSHLLEASLPVNKAKIRNSLQRRIDRGKRFPGPL